MNKPGGLPQVNSTRCVRPYVRLPIGQTGGLPLLCLRHRQDLGDALQRPIQFVFRDDQWRGQADDCPVGILGQHAQFL